MNSIDVVRAYDRMADLYDLLFDPFFAPARREITGRIREHLPTPRKVLEVGVGTGASLPLYPDGVEVTGIDLSERMLRKAQQRIERHSLGDRTEVRLLNAEETDFADDTFDVSVAMYVVSVTPNPVKLMAEMARVTKPGGTIYIVNHFASRSGLPRLIEGLFAPLEKKLGWRLAMSLDGFLAEVPLEVRTVAPINFLGYWKFLELSNKARNPSAVAECPQWAAGAVSAARLR